MSRYAELPDGTRLEFPDNTPDEVIDRTVRGHIARMQQEPPPPRETSLFAAGLQSLTQGASLGWADEAAAGLAATVQAPFSSRTFGGIYSGQLEEERANLEAARAKYPRLFKGGEIVGAIAPTARLAQASKALPAAARNLPTWMKAAGIGAAEGTVYGAGASEGNRAQDAAIGGAIGGVASPVIAAAARPLLTGARNFAGMAMERLRATPRREAERLVGQAMQNDMLDPTVLQRLGGESPLLLADLGENTAGLLRGATAKPGPARTAAREILDARQAGQQGRLIRGLGVQGTEAFKDSFDDWAASRITSARPLYEQAFAAPLQVSESVVSRLQAAGVMGIAKRKLAIEGGQPGQVALFDAAKRALDDKIGMAIRAGKADDARLLTMLKRDLVGEMDAQVPVYAQARSVYSGEAAIRNAADFGTELFERRISHDAARRIVADMTESERAAFQRGALRGLVELLERTPENRNAANKLIDSTAVRDKLRLLFTDEGGFLSFVQQAVDEARMSYTRNMVLGGSPTARIQEEARAITSTGEIIRDAATGNTLGLFSRFLRSLGIGEPSPETLDELSKLLLTPQSPAKLQRLSQMIGQPPPGPIALSTQIGAGALMGGQSAAETARMSNAERRRKRLASELYRTPLGGGDPDDVE